MKRLATLLVVSSFAFAAQASEKSFRCFSEVPLWSVIEDVTFTVDAEKQSMKLSFSDGDSASEVNGTVDPTYKPRLGNRVRFLNSEDGSSDFDDLTSESYICEIFASGSLMQANSKGGTLSLSCRGESFENAKYSCK